MKSVPFTLVVLFLLVSCSSPSAPLRPSSSRETPSNLPLITLTTSDGVSIAATSWNGGTRGIILLHMLSRNRGDWDDFAKTLQLEGFSVLAVDFRGHGQSGGTLSSDVDYGKMINDVSAAVEYLHTQNIRDISIIGASIGANVAVKYTQQYPGEVKKLILLSPGLSYRSIGVEEDAKKLTTPTLFVASTEDVYSFQSTQTLHALALGEKKLLVLENAGHGTQMLASNNVTAHLVQWLKEK